MLRGKSMKYGLLRYFDISLLCYTLLLLIFSFSSAKTTKENPVNVAKEFLGVGKKIRVPLFIPDIRVKPILLGLIISEQKSISAAQFRLNDKDIAQALIDAHKRGIPVRIVTDQSAFFDKYNKINALLQAGIEIRWYVVPFSIMHHKFFIFGKNLTNEPLLVTGSANMTVSGYTKNQENLNIFNDRSLITAYEQQFERLLKRTVREMPAPAAALNKALTEKVFNIPLPKQNLLKSPAKQKKACTTTRIKTK